MFVERTLSLALVTESWSLYLDGWPRSGTIVLPIQPGTGGDRGEGLRSRQLHRPS